MEQMNMQHEDKSLACRIRGCAEVTRRLGATVYRAQLGSVEFIARC